MMAILSVQNGYSADLEGLGKLRKFPDLSPKRAIKAVRDHLRVAYGFENVEVSCSACFMNGEWHGKCGIARKDFAYRIQESTGALSGVRAVSNKLG